MGSATTSTLESGYANQAAGMEFFIPTMAVEVAQQAAGRAD